MVLFVIFKLYCQQSISLTYGHKIMLYNFSQLKINLEKIKNNFKNDVSALRAGRATPDLVSKILIDCYGEKMPLEQLAAINIEDAKTIRIQPWDKNVLVNIEQGIRNSEIGLQPIVDKETLRVILPELTSERRKQLIKILKEKLEKARIDAKLEREEIWRDIQLHEKKGDLSEDEKFHSKDELQKIVDKLNKELEEIFMKKEKELTDF